MCVEYVRERGFSLFAEWKQDFFFLNTKYLALRMNVLVGMLLYTCIIFEVPSHTRESVESNVQQEVSLLVLSSYLQKIYFCRVWPVMTIFY